MQYVFHQAAQAQVHDILRHGLLQGSGGERHDEDIQRADTFLNGLRPAALLSAGLDRERNVYCYLPAKLPDTNTDSYGVVDIVTGNAVPLQDAPDDADHVMLRITVGRLRCFVGDLDLYDEIKHCLKRADKDRARTLGGRYWTTVQPLSAYGSGATFQRPEVMVVEDIPADMVTVIAAAQ